MRQPSRGSSSLLSPGAANDFVRAVARAPERAGRRCRRIARSDPGRIHRGGGGRSRAAAWNTGPPSRRRSGPVSQSDGVVTPARFDELRAEAASVARSGADVDVARNAAEVEHRFLERVDELRCAVLAEGLSGDDSAGVLSTDVPSTGNSSRRISGAGSPTRPTLSSKPCPSSPGDDRRRRSWCRCATPATFLMR